MTFSKRFLSFHLFAFICLLMGCGEAAPVMRPRLSSDEVARLFPPRATPEEVAHYRQGLAELALSSVVRKAQAGDKAIDVLPLTPDAMLRLAVAMKMVDQDLSEAFSWPCIHGLIDGMPFTLKVGAMTAEYAHAMDPERVSMVYLREREMLLLDERNLDRLPPQVIAAGLIYMVTAVQVEREIAQVGGYTPTEYRALLAACGNVMRMHLFVSHALAIHNTVRWFVTHRDYLRSMPEAVLPQPFYHHLASTLSREDRSKEFGQLLWRFVSEKVTHDRDSPKNGLCRFPMYVRGAAVGEPFHFTDIAPWLSGFVDGIPAD